MVTPRRSAPGGPRRSRILDLLAAGALAAAALVGGVLVFQPDAATSSDAVQRLTAVLFRAGVPWRPAAEAVGLALNVALFVPGAFAAALLWPRVRWWQWVLVGLLISGAIETVQGVFLPGRQAEVADLAANTLGGALGTGLAVAVRALTSRRS